MKIPKLLAEKAIAAAKENDLKTAILKLAQGLWILSGVVRKNHDDRTKTPAARG